MWNKCNLVDVKDLEGFFDIFTKEVNNSLKFTTGNFPSEEFTDHGDKFIATFDVPGVDKKDIEIEYNNNILVVKAKRSEDKIYSGKWKITQVIDSDAISAKLENGVLTITMPKKNLEKSKKIAVE